VTWGKFGKHGKKLRSEIGKCGNDRGAIQGARRGCKCDFHNSDQVGYTMHVPVPAAPAALSSVQWCDKMEHNLKCGIEVAGQALDRRHG